MWTRRGRPSENGLLPPWCLVRWGGGVGAHLKVTQGDDDQGMKVLEAPRMGPGRPRPAAGREEAGRARVGIFLTDGDTYLLRGPQSCWSALWVPPVMGIGEEQVPWGKGGTLDTQSGWTRHGGPTLGDRLLSWAGAGNTPEFCL